MAYVIRRKTRHLANLHILVQVLSCWQLEYQWKIYTFEVSMSIKIIGHPCIFGERLVKMSQVTQGIDMLSQSVKVMVAIMGHLSRNISTMSLIFIRHRGTIYCKIPEPSPLFCTKKHLIRKKNSLENFCNCKLIHENHESFPPRTICIIQYVA